MRIVKITLVALFALTIFACSENEEPFIVPIVEGAVIDAQVGGANQPNQVYIDLSTETTTAVARNSYDLGFYTGSDFRVVLNNSASSLAYALDKTDLNEVSAEDTIGLSGQLDVNAIFSAAVGAPQPWLANAASWMDDPSGDLSKTAIAEISTTDNENQVYILNRGNNPDGSSRGWKKIRVIRADEGYQLQHADIGAATFATMDISKNSDLRFVQMNFDAGIVQATPASVDWDLAFTTFTNLLPLGPAVSIPYGFKDYVITNADQVQVAQVNTEDVSYEDLSMSDIAAISLENTNNGIGSSWRTVGQPGTNNATGVVEDIFYVLKDGSENYYKIRFTRLVDPNTGERGFPQLQYNLIKE